MLESDYFARKRQELGLERGDDLVLIQQVLERHYPTQVRAKSLQRGVLKLQTPNASVASALRMRQVELQAEIATLPLSEAVNRLQIVIG